MKNQENDFISGYFLEMHKWEESKTEKNTWTREVAKVRYDGTNWYYNGKQIEDSIRKNPYLKVPQANPILPPLGFKSIEDYYNAMMELK